MSGGSINYLYSRIGDTIRSLRCDVETAESELESLPHAEATTAAMFKLKWLREALDDAQRRADEIDGHDGPLYVAEWRRSGDYGDNTATTELAEWWEKRRQR
jgi:hypothetical protein